MTCYPKKSHFFLCALLLIVFGSVWSWAAQRSLTLDQLCKISENIVVGTVQKVEGYHGDWPGVGRVVFSDITIQVQDQWKGELPSTELVLQNPGGIAPDGQHMRASGMAEFKEGEKVLVFVNHQNGRRWVAGWIQGKYEIVVERVVGVRGYAVGQDSLTHHLKPKVKRIVEAQQRSQKGR